MKNSPSKYAKIKVKAKSRLQALLKTLNKIRVKTVAFLFQKANTIGSSINPSLLSKKVLEYLKTINWQDTFSDFLGPKSVVGLLVTEKFIGAVQIFESIKGVEIDRTVYMDLKDEKESADGLRDFFNQANLKYQSLITGLPISSAVVRQIPVSFENTKKLHKIMKYQMESHIPFPIDNMVVDFLSPGPDKNILTVGINKDVLSEHLSRLAAADLEPAVVGLNELSLLLLYKKTRDSISEQPVAIIHFSDGKRVVMVIAQNSLGFVRILPEEKNRVDHLADTFKLYQLENPENRIAEILLTGQPGVNDGLAKEIRSRLKIETSVWRPFDELKHKLGKVKTDMQSKLSVPLGLALSIGDPKTKTLDFRKEEFTFKRAGGLKNTLIYAASAFLLLVGLFTFNIYHQLHTLQTRDSYLKTQMDKILTDDFPEVKIIKGREKDQYEQKVKEKTAEYIWIDDLTKGGSTLDSLMALTKAISKFKDIKIESLLMEKEIRLHGMAPSFEVVDQLKREFSSNPFFKTANLVDAKMDKRVEAVKFNFALEKK